MQFGVDTRFREHFRGLQQVFLYVTDECNLRCIHCLYRPNVAFHLKEKEIEPETARALVSAFGELGARKLTILGGEPTLYGTEANRTPCSCS